MTCDWIGTGWAWGIASLCIITVGWDKRDGQKAQPVDLGDTHLQSLVLIFAYYMKFLKVYRNISFHTLVCFYLCSESESRAHASVCKESVKSKLVGIVQVKTEWQNEWWQLEEVGQEIGLGFWPRGQLTISPDLSSMQTSHKDSQNCGREWGTRLGKGGNGLR